MLSTLFALPLAQKFVTAPKAQDAATGGQVDPLVIVIMLALLLGSVLFVLVRRPIPAQPEQPILIDGSNVIHWQDNTPQLEPLLQVVRNLSARGLKVGVVFDANVGYKLTGKFLGERDLSRLLALPRSQIFVVPKGTQADPYLLDTARHLKAQIVTNDRFRDWAEVYPEVAEPGWLISGGIRDGQPWLNGLEAREGAP